MRTPKIGITVTDNDTGITFKCKLRVFFPNFKSMSKSMIEFLSSFECPDALYLHRMFKIKTFFPNDDIIHKKTFDLKNYICDDLFSAPDNSTLKSSNTNEIDLKQLIYKKHEFNLNMTEEGYNSFKELVFEEIEYVERELDELFKSTYRETLKKFNIIKKIKAKLIVNDDMKEDLKKKCISRIIHKANKFESEIDGNNFFNRASELINKFNLDEYQNLLTDIITTYSTAYESRGKDHFKEQIEALNQARETTNYKDILYWIINNCSSREEAYRALLFEADDLYQQFWNWFLKNQYKTLRKKMNYYEKRLFQLLFLGRKKFDFRTPAFEPLFSNFLFNSDDATKAFLLMVLVYKNDKFGMVNIKKELEYIWKKYLLLYSSLSQEDIKLSETLSDKTKCLEIGRKVCNNHEYSMLKAIIDYNDPQLLSIKFGIKSNDVIGFIESFKNKVQNEIHKKGDNFFDEEDI